MATMSHVVGLVIVSCFTGLLSQTHAAAYLGKPLGKLTELHHGVSGEVFAVDARTLHIKDFTYDGQGPAAYFFAGSSRAPSNAGFRIRDEKGSPEVLRRYRKEGVTLTLPEGKSLNDIKWFSVWCEEFEVNFGDVKIPKNFDYPRPQKIDGLKGVHGVSSDNIVIVDAQTLLVPNFSYDGEAPDAKFWVGRGSKPTPQGIKVPDENGRVTPLRWYDHKTVVLTLPTDITVFDIGHFGVWCEAFAVDFGHVQIPQLANVPPSLKMLGVSPQSKLNCEVLHDDLAFEVRWAVAGDSIVLQLVAKLENREYMSFGISGDETKSKMIGGDVVVAWVDKETLKGYADDYYLDAKSQCSGPSGSCPDNKLAENTDSIRLLNAAMVNGYSIVTYQRPLRPADAHDKQIYTNKSQAIIWAIGPLNDRNEVSFHSLYTDGDKLIEFGRAAKWNCPMPEAEQPSMRPATSRPRQPEEDYEEVPVKPSRNRNQERRRGNGNRENIRDSEKSASGQRATERRGSGGRRPAATPAPVSYRNAWVIPPIECHEPDDGVFYAQMGPTGGKHGYPAITGHVGWGISWYINGLLIPEINVVRATTYTFVVEGGYDPEIPAKYHPFYITDDPVGGYQYKTPEEQKAVRIFAGARIANDGTVQPTGVGRLCHWTHTGDKDADDFESFGAYQRTLELKCDQGEPGFIQWTPDKDTPDTVYYQCFSHRYLGWKINVHDDCDDPKAASEIHETVVRPDDPMEDLEDSPSIRVETRVKPNDIYKPDQASKKADVFEDSSSEETLIINVEEASTTEEAYTTEAPTSWSDELYFSKNVPPNLTFTEMPPKPPKVVVRRPVLLHPRPPFMKPFIKAPNRRGPPMMVKKPYYRPLMKVPPMRPVVMLPKYEKPIMLLPPRSQGMRRPHKPPVVLVPADVEKVPSEIVVEVSPQQASTESQPVLQTRKTLILTKQEEKEYKAYVSMKPAVNTGFNPASVVIESGFKPIISKEIEDRMAQHDEPEIEFESEIGVIDETKEPTENTQKATEFFEPMFIPSPTIDVQMKKSQVKYYKPKKRPIRVYVKQGRNPREDTQAAANERIESYYLPPDNNRSKPVARVPQFKSNIDIAPDTVVTYDGKKVSGASLTVRSGEHRSVLDQRGSKASELVRIRPQTVPYKGELPPLDPKIINFKAPQLQARTLSRELDTPAIPTTTKLKFVRQLAAELHDVRTRSRREAHHTEEHTAQQEKEKAEAAAAEAAKSSSGLAQSSIVVLVCALLLR